MLNVLLESSAKRRRSLGGTITSLVLHAGLIAGAVALTVPRRVNARPVERMERPIIHIVPRQPAGPRTSHPRGPQAPGAPTLPRVPDFHNVVIDEIPPIDLGPVQPRDDLPIGGGVETRSPIGGGGTLGGAPGSAIDERLVDRAPHVIGRAIEPRYPAALRDAGVQGRVVVQFVIDTLGRAELDELQVVESAHPQFVEAIRAALARYRFSPGEAGGRRVRTRVQLPFDFALVR